MTIIDLATTIIPRDHKVWKLFPGEGYKFNRLIDASKVAFLDFRTLDRMGDDPRNWGRAKLENVLSIDRWSRQNAGKSDKTERRVSPTDKSNATLVLGLLTIAKKGDLVAVPNPGPDGYVAIYELTSGPGSVSRVEAQDGRATSTYLGRKVKWVGTLPKRRLEYGVVELLQTPVAFFDLGDAGREQIYEEVFGNYVYRGDNTVTYRVAKSDYNSRDNRIVSSWMEFVDLVSNDVAFTKALSASSSASVVAMLDLVDLTESDRSELSININSPGEILMAAKRLAPLIGLALFPLAVSGVSYNDAIAAQVQMTTLGGATDDCTAQIQTSVQAIIKAMGADKWINACELAQAASSKAELSTDAKLD